MGRENIMKKSLPMLICVLAMQIASCEVGTIEVYPESTKFSIQNNSGLRMLDVAWIGIGFGDIGLGEITEKEVSEGNGKVTFKANGKEYLTYNTIKCEKHRRNKFTFVDATFVEYNGERISIKNILNAD
jgi:hypothetical protein